MANIRPLKALRPKDGETAKLISAPPYDVLSIKEAKELAADNPLCFLHVERAEIDIEECSDRYSQEVYDKAAENFQNMIENGSFIEEETPCLYVYRLTSGNISQTGLAALSSVDDYLDNVIKKHELTRADKEKDRIDHMLTIKANAGPIFEAYKSNPELLLKIKSWAENNTPIYDFLDENSVKHEMWVIDDEDYISQIVESFKSINTIYIADGHHRAAASARICLQKRKQGDYTGDEDFNYFLSVIFDSSELKIMGYNRVVKDLNGHSTEEFLNLLGERFSVSKVQFRGVYNPIRLHQFGMYVDGCWYRLEAKAKTIKPDPVGILDVSILYNEALKPILNIGDQRTDQRIAYVGGARGTDYLQDVVDSGDAAVAFCLYPTNIKDLMTVSDCDKIMPPKSTWFEPKLRSGLLVHKI